jgi:hypothetical protein
MQPHFKGSCGTCHCASRHSLLHFHSNFLHALSRQPFQRIEKRQRYRHKNPFVDRGAAHPRRCSCSTLSLIAHGTAPRTATAPRPPVSTTKDEGRALRTAIEVCSNPIQFSEKGPPAPSISPSGYGQSNELVLGRMN